ncbi:MAG: hypothetical protein ACNS60_14870 [Candidatus Cyclobacteriaceae bacterium M2_1C_046]
MKSTGIIFSLTLVMLIFSACQGNREMVHTFGYYDTNQDYEVDPEEFNTVFANQGDFKNWDIDEDRRLTEDEWNEGFNVYGSSYPYEERGLFDDWDTDNDAYVDNDEYNEGFFDLFDADGDGIISQDEWEKYERD